MILLCGKLKIRFREFLYLQNQRIQILFFLFTKKRDELKIITNAQKYYFYHLNNV